MALAHDIQLLRDRVLTEFNAAYDYYTDTIFAWNIVRETIVDGNTFFVQNVATGTLTTHMDLVDKSRRYMAEQLAEATFQQFIAIFENFFFDLLRLWLIAYPQNLIGKKVEFKAILDAPDKDAITSLVVNKELNEILYERPTGCSRTSKTEPNSAAPRHTKSTESPKPKPGTTYSPITGAS